MPGQPLRGRSEPQPSGRGRRLADHPSAAALRSPALRRYLAGQLPSVTCSWAQVVALAWVVVQLDPAALGLVILLQFLPTLVIGPWFGALADRYDRRRLLMIAETGLALVAAGYALAAAAGALTLPMIFLLAGVWGVINALDTPARRAMVPMLVPSGLAPAASALTGTAMLFGMTAGSALGGILVSTVGVSLTFLINAASFAADVIILATIRTGPSPRVARAAGQVRAGLRYLWSTPPLRATMIAFALVATFGFTLQVSVPILVRVTFDGGPDLVGAAFTAGTAGSLAGMVATAARRGADPPSLARAAAGLGAALLLTAAAPVVPVLLFALAAAGFAWSVCIIAATATLQSAEPAMTGRVMAIFAAVLLGGTATGGPIAAAVADLTDPRAPFVVGTLAAAGAAFLASTGRARFRTGTFATFLALHSAYRPTRRITPLAPRSAATRHNRCDTPPERPRM
ncbi:MFS transporter [Microlunatus speluncae]|uniref:MFS transporter n=1 Tax=Microlunatus speluncae TaxID=2594267 RepID=UPI0012660A2C|nr:MFS transporter [Microlunatus speluncae]